MVDIVVLYSQLAAFRKQQEECCRRLKAANVPARILTFAYDAQMPFPTDNDTQRLHCAEAAEICCHSLSLEREASGRSYIPIIFITARDSVASLAPMILGHNLSNGLGSLREEMDNISVSSGLIKRSTFSVLRLPASPYTFRQRVLETGILSSLQAVGIIALHVYGLYRGDASPERRQTWSSLAWLDLDITIRALQCSPGVLFVKKALKYAVLGYFALGYVCLATMQFDVNRDDRLQWIFVVVGILVAIATHLTLFADPSANPKALILMLAAAITGSMVFSTWAHWVWRAFSSAKDSGLEKKVGVLVQRASRMIPGDPSHFIEYDTSVDNVSTFTVLYWGLDIF